MVDVDSEVKVGDGMSSTAGECWLTKSGSLLDTGFSFALAQPPHAPHLTGSQRSPVLHPQDRTVVIIFDPYFIFKEPPRRYASPSMGYFASFIEPTL